ncbi:MAG TPA: CoA transferase, partial [Dehalococcoidia bacterium]|nr:CoA transferase [Dehalococcoidia bacterium]
MSAGDGVLDGVRVLDLTDETAVFGPKLLADLGADVLRIEPPDGDPIRRLGPFAGHIVDPERSLPHWWFNSSKRSAVLDLRSAAGRQRLAELAGGADVLIETGDIGLDLPGLREANPLLTIVSVSGFGRTGPRRDRLAPDLVSWALSGAMACVEQAGHPPLRPAWGLADQIAGIYAAIGALAGLHHCRLAGHGLHFDLARLEAVASVVAAPVATYRPDLPWRDPRLGLEVASITPWGAFPTRDGQIVFMAVTQGQWSALLGWMDETSAVEDWARDEALLTLAGRVPHRARINEWLARWTHRFTTAEVLSEAIRRDLPCTPINAPIDVLADEQLRARHFFVPIEQPTLGGQVEYPGLPYRLAGRTTLRAAP